MHSARRRHPCLQVLWNKHTHTHTHSSSSLIAHVLHSPPPPREQLCNRSCSNKTHTHTHTQMLDLTQEVHGRMLMTIMSKLGISDEDYEVWQQQTKPLLWTKPCPSSASARRSMKFAFSLSLFSLSLSLSLSSLSPLSLSLSLSLYIYIIILWYDTIIVFLKNMILNKAWYIYIFEKMIIFLCLIFWKLHRLFHKENLKSPQGGGKGLALSSRQKMWKFMKNLLQQWKSLNSFSHTHTHSLTHSLSRARPSSLSPGLLQRPHLFTKRTVGRRGEAGSRQPLSKYSPYMGFLIHYRSRKQAAIVKV